MLHCCEGKRARGQHAATESLQTVTAAVCGNIGCPRMPAGPPAMAPTSSAGAARQRIRRRLSSTADSASLHKWGERRCLLAYPGGKLLFAKDKPAGVFRT